MFDALPIAAFLGSAVAVTITLAVGGAVGRSTSTASLLLAGVAVASLFTAIQTYIQQRESATLRQVYSWILGRLSTSGWDEVIMILPYAAYSAQIIIMRLRTLPENIRILDAMIGKLWANGGATI